MPSKQIRTTHKLHNPKINESQCNLINPYLFQGKIKHVYFTKHAKQTSQDCLKLASKAWTWQGRPENKHAKQSTRQENKTCKQSRFYTHIAAVTKKHLFCTETLLHSHHFTQRRFNTQTLLHTKTFTHKSFYTQTLLHRFTFTHKHFYTNIFTQKHSYTQTRLHTKTFTHRSFYTQKLLHTNPFTQIHFYTQTLLHTNIFTQKHSYTQTRLHTKTFTHRSFYKHTHTFTQMLRDK